MNFFEEDRLSRILKLIQKKPYVTLNDLAEKIGVSTRTIRNDVKQLNEELKEIAFLESDQGSYRLYITNQNKFESKMKKLLESDDYFNSPQKRMAFIIQALMRSEKPYLIDDLAFDMNIGRTTLTGDLKKTKEILKPYSLDIIGKTNTGLELQGQEINLRFFILENMYETIYDQYPIDKEIVDIVENIMDKYYFETATKNEFLKAVTIMLDRFLTKNTINNLDKKYYSLKDSPAYEIVTAVSKAVEKELQIIIPLEEQLFIALPIVGMRTPTNIDFMSLSDITEDTKEIIEKIKNQVYYELNLELNFNGFLDEFAYHIKFMINRLLFGFRLKNPIANEVIEKYPLAYKMAKIAGNVIEKKYLVTVTEDELGYLTAYFGVCLIENVALNEYRVAIICGTGRGTARLIAAQLKKILDKGTVIDLYADNQATGAYLDNYDLIFSTIKLTLKTDKPIIIINEIFDEEEILSKIETVKYLNKLDIPILPGNNSIIASILDENRFFVLDNTKSYLENTNDMIDKLELLGIVDTCFKDRIKKREEKATMVFDKFIAFPHTVNHGSDKLVFALGVLPSPIYEVNKEIRLIFLLGLPEKEDYDDTLLVKIYDEIIAIAQKKDVVKEISHIENYQQLVRYFIKISKLF